MHWAAALIGLPWIPGGCGPEGFDCWGLVRHVQSQHYGRELPVLAGATEGRVEQAKTLMRGWIRATTPHDGDVMLCRSVCGPHVGAVLMVDGRLGVLHAVGGEGHGSVVFTPTLDQLCELGFSRPEYWRAYA